MNLHLLSRKIPTQEKLCSIQYMTLVMAEVNGLKIGLALRRLINNFCQLMILDSISDRIY